MEQLTLSQAAEAHADGWMIPTTGALKGAFKAGAKWQNKQNGDLLMALKQIASWPGNLPDDRLNTATGPNDARARGDMVITMRQFAITAIQKVIPDYKPFPNL